ncbi:DNA glycosylase/AP lyase, H2TH DNA-binding [Catenulispora acidiphila DSM 44928]|uniref:DNA-(apurinic or apyrimidinic site) lyase n=1 Tax=Catenulispora acidiphila (strain DSM 44928 / JCM 14897 / NBRC 102108 / NRRL B-24433 / ID139908) TaxID=479433 RepID=C7Q901_CATAD|nr:DNA-formamidopyrimidine glycosylase family protein [Catenulispora acidiphila]ACU72321.1 DNA glycosylase/AP lyase, H2TH DNA-binding [Catenulispora acidiphila DSM 44928]
MPEGDSVFRTAAQLHEALAGDVLAVSDLRVPSLATSDLTGRRVLQTVARGKHLLTRLEGDLTLHTHLRMEGRWAVYRTGERWTGGPGWQIRAVLGTARNTAVGYRLQVVDLLPTSEEPTIVGHLGPDLLGPDWDAEEALRRLSADPARPLGLALLDQRNLAGVGNVYANELSFLARVPPWRPVGEVPGLEKVVDTAHRLLTLNRLRTGHVTTGETRADRRNWVYGRARQPCRRCGTRILTSSLGTPPKDRVIYFCPNCQPER